MAKINVVCMVRTCEACPSQWVGLTDTGKVIYARYRSGRLRVKIGEITETLNDYEVRINIKVGDDYDGFMYYDVLRTACRDDFKLPDRDFVYGVPMNKE